MSQPARDPVIEEIREIRHQISAEFSHDPERLFHHFLEVQRQYQERLLQPEKLAPTQVAERA